MDSKFTKAIKAYLASATGFNHPPCGQYPADIFDDYWDELLSPGMADTLADHCLECPACLESMAKAKQLHDDSITLAGRMDTQRMVNAARKKLDDLTDVQNLKLKFAAAAPDAVMMGQALGVAIDIETGIGTTIECNACVGQKEKNRGKFEIWGRQVEGTEDGYRIEKPLDYLEEKLAKGVFRNCSELRAYNLDRRRISVDLRERIISHAGSLSLAIVMSIVNAIHHRLENPPCLYSADIRQDGRLLKVGHIKAKIETALKYGILEVILPSENQPDVPHDHLNNPKLHILFFDTLGEVLTHFNLAPTPEVSQAKCTSVDPMDAMQDTAAGIYQDVHSRGVANSMACTIDNDYAPLFDRLGIEPAQRPFWNKLITFIEDLSQTGDFRDELSTAFLIGNLKDINRILPNTFLTFSKPKQIFDLSEVAEDLANLVDGRQLAFVMDNEGNIDSIRLIHSEGTFNGTVGQLLSPSGYRMAAISNLADSRIIYLTPAQNHVQIFCHGSLKARYCNGRWHMTDYEELAEFLKRIADQDGISWSVLKDVAKAATTLAEKGLGGTFAFISDAMKDQNLWENSLANEFGLGIENIKSFPLTSDLIETMARLKGAVIFDYHGDLIAINAYLCINDAEVGENFSFGRHQVAQLFSKRASGSVIVASRYSAVTLFYRGQRIFSM